MNPPTIDITGQRFGALVALRVAERGRRIRWECLCDCGRKHIATSESLRYEKTKSCGCSKGKMISDKKITHGESNNRRRSRSPEYNSWRALVERCECPTNHAWDDYGGRGIKVCDRWSESFQNFLDDMGRKPSPDHSIDRYPDKNGNYEPANCRWATWVEQANNRREPKRKGGRWVNREQK